MPRGGARPGSGPKPRPKPEPVADKHAATRLIEALNRPARRDTPEIAGWRVLWEAQDLRIRLDVRKYLYDKRDGKPVQTINHLHDKPIDLNVNHSLGERMKIAMEKANARVHNGR